MKSAIAITSEIDNLEAASEELVSKIKEKLAFGKTSVGMVYCDADVNVAELGGLLHKKLGIDIVGLTTTAFIERFSGYSDMGIVLSVITGDDINIAVGNTGELAQDNFKDKITAAYTSARGALGEEPKLILLCAPYIAALTSENYLEVLDAASNHAPIFGGVATDHYDLQYQKTFFNANAYTGALQFVLISGNIKPVFAMQHKFGAKIEKKGIITKASANQVEEVDGKTFKEFLSGITNVPNEETVIYHFQSTPFVMELPDYEDNEQPVARALCTIDHNTGAGGFLSKMPEGSKLSLNVLQRENLAESCENTITRLLEEMSKNKSYDYSMILISTCNARHLLMADKKDLESGIVTGKLSVLGKDINAMGFYGFGEMCPTSVEGGKAKNRFHNISFALCAF